MTVITIEGGYLKDEPYGTGAYATGKASGHTGWQADVINQSGQKPTGKQAEQFIQLFPQGNGFQINGLQKDVFQSFGFEARIDKSISHVSKGTYLVDDYATGPYLAEKACASLGMSAEILVSNTIASVGYQSEIDIEEVLGLGFQAEITLPDQTLALGLQALVIQTVDIGFQANINLYNVKKLRILCDFPSRGTAANNWTASSTEPGDFDIENVDTDITEQIWRSAAGVVTGITLTDDTGAGQSIFVDTFAMINHNLTTSATVTLLGADNPIFSPVGFSQVLEVTADNMYYIAPDLPTSGFRYWRLIIDDATNPDNFVSIGAIIFGASDILSLDCGFTDNIGFERRDFTDKIGTEGFTNVSNSRALKRIVNLEFRNLPSQNRSATILKRIFEQFRTTFKCLWIPTPSATDQSITGKFAVFGKLSRLPRERHNSKSEPNNDFINFTIEVDESL